MEQYAATLLTCARRPTAPDALRLPQKHRWLVHLVALAAVVLIVGGLMVHAMGAISLRHSSRANRSQIVLSGAGSPRVTGSKSMSSPTVFFVCRRSR